jgi:glyoxylase-like metal-dependent hydrolase (beta-lactamase superfamily II)
MRSTLLAIAIAIVSSMPACSKTEPPPAAQASPAEVRTPEARTPEDPNLVWTPSSVVLVKKELAPGVYAVYPDDAPAKNAAGIPAATAGGFVVGDRGVLVVESMLNRRLANQVLALVREVTSKPIIYVVNTSYHGDHSYGNQFFPAATQFVQHVETQAYVQAHFADDVAFMKKYFGTNQGLDELSPQPAQVLLHDGANLELDVGGKRASVLHLGFAQTKGDLFVWLPKQKVLFTGNPVISDGPSIPWLLDGQLDAALATLRKVRALVPGDAIVVPGHGEPAGVAAIDKHIAYLEELRKQVSDAVAQGLSEKETVARVSEGMKKYAAYKIYPWVHSQVNLPKAYQELKAGK